MNELAISFEGAHALDVGLHALATGAGASAADGVGCLHDNRLDVELLDLVMMAGDAIEDFLVHAVALTELRADDGVRAFNLMIDRLTDVVQQATHLAIATSAPSSAAIMPARCAVSMAWAC